MFFLTYTNLEDFKVFSREEAESGLAPKGGQWHGHRHNYIIYLQCKGDKSKFIKNVSSSTSQKKLLYLF